MLATNYSMILPITVQYLIMVLAKIIGGNILDCSNNVTPLAMLTAYISYRDRFIDIYIY